MSRQDVLEGRERWALECADNAEVLPTLPDKSVAHVITDPPYEAEAHTLQRRVFRKDLPPGDYGPGKQIGEAPLGFAPIDEEGRARLARESARLARRWIAAFCQVEAAMRWADAFTAAGAVRKRIAVWVKPDGMPQFSGDRPGMGYESIVLCHAAGGKSTWNGGGKHGVFTHPCHRDPGDNSGHETQKPLSLMLELVELFTDPDDIILDPFAGSGTTGAACLRLGRRFIGIERDPKYAAVARERLEAESRGLTLRDARAGQISLFEGPKP